MRYLIKSVVARIGRLFEDTAERAIARHFARIDAEERRWQRQQISTEQLIALREMSLRLCAFDLRAVEVRNAER